MARKSGGSKPPRTNPQIKEREIDKGASEKKETKSQKKAERKYGYK